MFITRLGLKQKSFEFCFESFYIIFCISNYYFDELKALYNRFTSFQAYKAEKKRITSQGESEAAQLREENEKLRRELEDAKQQVKGSYDFFLNRNRWNHPNICSLFAVQLIQQMSPLALFYHHSRFI